MEIDISEKWILKNKPEFKSLIDLYNNILKKLNSYCEKSADCNDFNKSAKICILTMKSINNIFDCPYQIIFNYKTSLIEELGRPRFQEKNKYVSRIVSRGTIRFENELYSHAKLLPYNNASVLTRKENGILTVSDTNKKLICKPKIINIKEIANKVKEKKS